MATAVFPEDYIEVVFIEEVFSEEVFIEAAATIKLGIIVGDVEEFIIDHPTVQQ